jgi:hypothetical protein
VVKSDLLIGIIWDRRSFLTIITSSGNTDHVLETNICILTKEVVLVKTY